VDSSAEKLLEAARKASAAAHCPYSDFPVGAAVEGGSGQRFTGCNIENASYGLTICAERVAIFAAVAAGEREIKRLTVSCPKGSAEQPGSLMPCGACRQVMAEFFSEDAVVHVDGVGSFGLKDLLPSAFALP
jgi:cytidine deaminase